MNHNNKIQTVLTVIFILVILFAIGTVISNGSFQPSLISAYPAPETSPLSQDPYPGPNTNTEPFQPVQNVPTLATTNSQPPDVRIYPSQLLEPTNLGFDPSAALNASPTSPSIPEGWSQLFFDDSPLKNLQWPCDTPFDYSSDGFERYWASSYNYDVSSDAAWPASGGANSVNPSFSNYPSNMYTWFFCGRYDMSSAESLKVKFDAFINIPDPDDYLQIAVGVGSSILWQSERLSDDSSANDWRTFETVPIDDIAGLQEVWIGFLFISDGDGSTGEGVWLDNIEANIYKTPSVCGNLDPGDKGLNIDSHMVQSGDTSILDKVSATGTNWVRFVFKPMPGQTVVDVEDYDFIVDGLCERGVSVVAVVNEETISNIAYTPESPGYRQAFYDEVNMLVDHFDNRVTYWEVWNEPDNFIGGTTVPPYVSPFVYAPLLAGAYDNIKTTNPDARVIYGGLASAWEASRNYFDDTYTVFQLSGIYPFDYLAIHPYTDGRLPQYHGVNPDVYMQAIDPPYDTILDPFLETMASSGQGNKTVWITELGWNSSLGASNAPQCLNHILVYESDQEDFLTKSFDFLFNNVYLWGSTNQTAVEKTIWYQFMDVGIDADLICGPGQPVDAYAWSYGLYNGNLNLKPSWWAFWAYPLDADDISRVHLPLIQNSSGSGTSSVSGNPGTIPALVISSANTTGDVEIIYGFYDGVEQGEPDEYIEIRNNDSYAVQLQDWTLRGRAGVVYTFPYLALQPGQVCRVYTNEYHAQWCGLIIESNSGVWSNLRDVITLSDSAGQVKDSCSYIYQEGTGGISCTE